MFKEEVELAFCLTGLGACGTFLGGLLVVIQPKNLSNSAMGFLQGMAAGLMLCISFVDLFPAAVNEIGFFRANVWFYIGALAFFLVVRCVPEPQLEIVENRNDEDNGKDKYNAKNRRKLLLSGLITALCIALHNFPEGVAVFLAASKSAQVGWTLAIAIAIHNIPEGVAVALPIYFATGSTWKGLRYAALSGLAEPLGVFLLGVLLPFKLSEDMVECMMAAVAGIMAFLTLYELVPLAIQYSGKEVTVMALLMGMILMSLNLYYMDH
eukprot:TRINITY_DN6439_c0_g2_i1.p2 TRINITY_DN6439_c0_g2~~TRINITY_DN6439_c0_g2_i1.p2  ORF type:complete len:267 (-),score=41.17 TRINITY_DN6439_c0_g2_i1:175-975(-)